MTAVKEYAYLIARNAVGVLLILSGAIHLGRMLQVLFAIGPIRHLFWHGNLYSFTVSAVLDIIPIVLGIAVLRQRARTLATAYCLLGVVTMILRFFFRYPFGEEHMLYLAGYFVGAIVLLIPRPRITVRNAPATPDGANWRRWLLASLQGEGVRPVRDRFQRGFGALFLVVVGFLLMLVVVLFFNIPVIFGAAPRGLMYVIIPIVLLVLFGLRKRIERLTGGTLKEIEQRAMIRVQSRGAEEELQRAGSRRPVFYLRAFALDAHTRHEAEVVRELRKVGPVIAIGRPGEDLPPMGAARFYVDDAHWKAKVADVVRVSQLVIWATGVTEGLRWELTHLRETLPPEKLILWAHPHLLGLYGSAAEAEWTRFLTVLGPLFPVPLPAQLGDFRFFFFDSDWRWSGVRSAGEGAQVAALVTVLVEKKLRRRQSSPEVTVRRFGARVFYYGLFVLFAVLIFLKFFR